MSQASCRSSQGYQPLAVDRSRRRGSRQQSDASNIYDAVGQEALDSEQWPLPHKARPKPPRRNRGMTVGAVFQKTLSRAKNRDSPEELPLDSHPRRERARTEVKAPQKPRRQRDAVTSWDMNMDETLTSFDGLLSPASQKFKQVADRSPNASTRASSPPTSPFHTSSHQSCHTTKSSRSGDMSDYLAPRMDGISGGRLPLSDHDIRGRVSNMSDIYRPSLLEAVKRRSHANENLSLQRSRDNMGAICKPIPPVSDSPVFSEGDFRSDWNYEKGYDSRLMSIGERYPEFHRSLRHGTDCGVYKSQDSMHIYADPIAIFKALPSRNVGPAKTGATRSKRGSVRASVNRFDGTIGLRSLASATGQSANGLSVYEEDYANHNEVKSGDVPPLPPKPAEFNDNHLCTVKGGVATDVVLNPSMLGVHTGTGRSASSCGIQASKSTFSVHHAGAGLSGNLNTRRGQLDRLRRPPNVGLSCTEMISYKLNRLRRRIGDYIDNAWFTIGFWRSSLKTIEGRFGTGVVAYFTFLRGMLFLNFLLTVLAMCFIVGPQISISASDNTLFPNDTFSPIWYNQLADAITGRGALRKSVIYQGAYSKHSNMSYKMPYAYFFTSFAILVVSFVWVCRRVAWAYQQRHVQKLNTSYKFTNKVFSGWDFNIANEESAYLKCVSIRRDFEEEIREGRLTKQKNSWRGWLDLIRRRVFVNVVVLGLLCLAGWCIFLATSVSIQASQAGLGENVKDTQNTALYYLNTLASSLTIAAFNAVLPTVFASLTSLEKWHTPGHEVKYTLMRTVSIRLASIGVLVVSLYLRLKDCSKKDFVHSPECQCWEVSVGQEFYQLAFINFVIVIGATMCGGLAQSILFYKWSWYREKIGPPNFPLVKNVLDLLYTQILVWLGFFFSPVIPAMAFVSIFCFFYAKKWSLLLFMIPSTKPFRGYRNSQLFNGLLLLVLCLSLIPLGLVSLKARPSPSCGPFRRQHLIYSGVADDLRKGPDWINQAIQLMLSHVVAIPAVLFLLLTIYYFRTKSRAHGVEVDQLQDQIEILVADKNFLVEKVQSIFAHNSKKTAKTPSKDNIVAR